MLPFGRENFLHFLTLQKQGKLTMQTAKAVISEMIQHGVDSEKAMDMLGIQEVTDEQIKAWVQQVFVEKPDLLEDLKTGNMKPLGFVTGQVMKRSGGSADPQKVQTILQQMIR